MKKRVLTAFVAVMVASILIGCDQPTNPTSPGTPNNPETPTSPGNDDPNEEFYGSWYRSWSEGDIHYSLEITLNSNGTFIMTEKDPFRTEKHSGEYPGIKDNQFCSIGTYILADIDGQKELALDIEHFCYINTDNNLITINESRDPVVCTVSVDGDELTATTDKEEMIFTKMLN